MLLHGRGARVELQVGRGLEEAAADGDGRGTKNREDDAAARAECAAAECLPLSTPEWSRDESLKT